MHDSATGRAGFDLLKFGIVKNALNGLHVGVGEGFEVNLRFALAALHALEALFQR